MLANINKRLRALVTQGCMRIKGGYWELIAHVKVAGRGVWEDVVWAAAGVPAGVRVWESESLG